MCADWGLQEGTNHTVRNREKRCTINEIKTYISKAMIRDKMNSHPILNVVVC